MIRPQRMKRIELTMLAKDADQVIEFLGRKGTMQFAEDGREKKNAPLNEQREAIRQQIKEKLETIQSAAGYLGIPLPDEPDETVSLPAENTDGVAAEAICAEIAALSAQETAGIQEKKKLEHTLAESKSFASLNVPFKDFNQLSYLTLRIGHIEPRGAAEMREHLSDHAVFIPLGENRVLAAASRKGRSALDGELKKYSFTPLAIPEGFRGIPGEMLTGLESRLAETSRLLETVETRKAELRNRYGPELCRLASSYTIASIIEDLKDRLTATRSAFFLSGWAISAETAELTKMLSELTEGRVSIRVFVPEEVERVKQGIERVPVSLKHGSFVKGFERLVFAYAAPLYGTIDPTPFVAVFFTILFGIMFGDLGQGLVLLAIGILTSEKGLKKLAGLRVYSTPLIAAGIAASVMGFLTGEVFAVEGLLTGPTHALLGLFMENPPDQILHLLPSAHNITTVFLFLGFTIGIGILMNSVGLWINVVNRFILKQYEKGLFSKSGIAGIVFFWYALFLGVRCLTGGSVAWFDGLGLGIPLFCIFFGPVLWRLIEGERPLIEEGLMSFIMEGFVEILETLSTNISNTVSFLRVGAFAVSHAVLSFIIFTLAEMIRHVPAGPVFSLIIMLFGNTLIILLEGMIVAIQVVRLQYYEFFSKFFTEMGTEFTPFRFREKAVSDVFKSKKVSANAE